MSLFYRSLITRHALRYPANKFILIYLLCADVLIVFLAAKRRVLRRAEYWMKYVACFETGA